MPAPICPSHETEMFLFEGPYGFMYKCNEPGCDWRVGCHQRGPKRGEPLGTPANRAMREARMEAHGYFDLLWKYPAQAGYTIEAKEIFQYAQMMRRRAYIWLAYKLKITIEECHIGQMDVLMCKQVINYCRFATPMDIRKWWKSKSRMKFTKRNNIQTPVLGG